MELQKKTLYVCEEIGTITTAPYMTEAHFSTAMKYDVLYQKELPRFRKYPSDFYAHPKGDTPSRIYRGLDRRGLNEYDPPKRSLNSLQLFLYEQYCKQIKTAWLQGAWLCCHYGPAHALLKEERTAQLFLNLLEGSEDYELLWARIYGAEDTVPDGYRFLGFDVTYMPETCGLFSMINDCMFIVRWHGCDEHGTLFLDDFAKLNENGLFDNPEDALAYMVKYLHEEWAENGEYGIFEIYAKDGTA